MNLRQRLVWTFVPLGLSSLALGAGLLWKVLDDTQRHQAEFLRSVMTDDIRLHTEYQYRVLHATHSQLLANMARAVEHLTGRSDFIAFVEKSQPEPLRLVLHRFIEVNRLDFALVFDMQGAVVSSAAPNEDNIEVARQFAKSALFEHLRSHLLDPKQDAALFTDFIRFDDRFVDLRKISQVPLEIAARYSYGPVSVRRIVNDYGEMLGWVVIGALMSHLMPIIEKSSRLAMASFVSFVEGTPYLSVGMPTPLPALNEAQRVGIAPSKGGIIDYSVGDVPYLLHCQQWIQFDGHPINANCIGSLLEPSLRPVHRVEAYGEQMRYSIGMSFILIGSGTFFVLLLAAVYLAGRVSRPIQEMTRILGRFAHNQWDETIPEGAGTSELTNLSHAMVVFRENALKRVEAEQQLLLTNEQLRVNITELEEAKAKAEVAETAKREFISVMGHELRTPLNAVIGFSQLLAQKLRTDPHHADDIRRLELITSSGNYLLQLVNDIMDIASSVGGRMHLNESRIRLAELVQLVCVQALPKAMERNIRIQAEVDEQLPMFWGDPDRLRQALHHILDNSIKFSHQNSVVHLFGEIRDDGALGLLIDDHGVGMDEGVRQSAFNLFKQGDSSSTRSHGGAGVGLTLANNIITLHGGHIILAGELGKGTRVTILIPRERIIQPTKDSARSDDASSSQLDSPY